MTGWSPLPDEPGERNVSGPFPATILAILLAALLAACLAAFLLALLLLGAVGVRAAEIPPQDPAQSSAPQSSPDTSLSPMLSTQRPGEQSSLQSDIVFLASLGDRSPGTPGLHKAADFIEARFKALGLSTGRQRWLLPAMRGKGSSLTLLDRGQDRGLDHGIEGGTGPTAGGETDRAQPGGTVTIHPLLLGTYSPAPVPLPGVDSRLVWGGDGRLAALDGKIVSGAIVLMDLDSGGNWRNPAMLGARAVVFIDRREASGTSAPSSTAGASGTPGHDKSVFEDKKDTAPIPLPRFWLDEAEARRAFGEFERFDGATSPLVRLVSETGWERIGADNVYGFVPGTNPALAGELVIVESFYDSSSLVTGRGPGAGEGISAAALLNLAGRLAARPPARPVLLLATAGHGDSLAGLREFVWALDTPAKQLRDQERGLKARRDLAKDMLACLTTPEPFDIPDPAFAERLRAALDPALRDAVDEIGRQLARLHSQGVEAGVSQTPEASPGQAPDTSSGAPSALRLRARELATERIALRRLGWRADYRNFTAEERTRLLALFPKATALHQGLLEDAEVQIDSLRSARSVREVVRDRELVAFVSLHLSDGGRSVGGFGEGWLYPLRPEVDRGRFRSTMAGVLIGAARRVLGETGGAGIRFEDTLRPGLPSWRSRFGDHPALGGEVTALAGLPGFTLATLDDSRHVWGTPFDTPERLDWSYLGRQTAFVTDLLAELASDPALKPGSTQGATMPDGFATVTGRTLFIRQGEVFADQPAPASVVQAWQGASLFHGLADETGTFRLKGMADRKHVLDKVVLEASRFDPATGQVKWAVDRTATDKEAIRLRLNRQSAETDLVMFECGQVSMYDLLEPRTFRPLTKAGVLDGRTESLPRHYGMSRMDLPAGSAGASGAGSGAMFLAPDTPLKLALSDTVLTRKLLLLNGSSNLPQGAGYLPEEFPLIPAVPLQAARDMWSLLGPRIANLETHGIVNERIAALRAEGTAALDRAVLAMEARHYSGPSGGLEEARASCAAAEQVYGDIETTQRDVLLGVLFYIAMFVPFAYVAERLLFGFTDIHKRIVAFLLILGAVIGVIYQVHPAFQLTYSPAVVILAFFIVALSALVSGLIFLRFEGEMAQLQQRAKHFRPSEISRGKAFAAAFGLGVSNLRRRRLRTALTCATLVILTFTLMSFTTVKTSRGQSMTRFSPDASYRGVLMRTTGWADLDPAAVDIVRNRLGTVSSVSARTWLESGDRAQPVRAPLRLGERETLARGVVGLDPEEPRVSGLDRALSRGRWFAPGERDALLLPERLAGELGLPDGPVPAEGWPVTLWGRPFRVVGVFGPALEGFVDLDGEPATPAVYPSEAVAQLTEAEQEAAQSGEGEGVESVASLQARYRHIPAAETVYAPSRTVLGMGGRLKGIAVARPVADQGGEPGTGFAAGLAERFGLTMLSGEESGTFLLYASSGLGYGGAPDVVVPMLISILIVLNTMIGSVYERKREIAVYTSVGLAPLHVAFLFVAEALAFAVISSVLGYLLAQTGARLLSGTALWSGMTANYSSLAGVAAMGLVILVVLVSVIYPAKVAADIAIPDVNRTWSLPRPVGDEMSLVLPFLIKLREQRCIGGYLCDYFTVHRDISHGLFSTGEVAASFSCPVEPGRPARPEGPECLILCATVWLAPFDFGIKQKVFLDFCPSPELQEFLEIRVRIVREAGEAGAWRRMNKAFLNNLRKQLLVWRSIDEAAQSDFAERLTVRDDAMAGLVEMTR